MALSALDEVTGQTGQAPMSGNIPKWARTVRLDDWRKAYYRISDAPSPEAAQKAFARAIKYLRDTDKVGVYDGWAWRTDANKHV
jgi:hypothetical protein